jgi:hypothetical protein
MVNIIISVSIIMKSIITIARGIQRGDVTHIHGQVMRLVSLSIRKIRNSVIVRLIPDDLDDAMFD